MASHTRSLLMVRMDVTPDKEAELNELYNHEHIPAQMNVPGIISAARYCTLDPEAPKYLAIYELESPEVIATEAFKEAATSGKWPHRVRPYTRNRSSIVSEIIYQDP